MTDAVVTEPHIDAIADGAPNHSVVWFELPAEDYERAIAFYEKMGVQQIGQMPNAMQSRSMTI